VNDPTGTLPDLLETDLQRIPPSRHVFEDMADPTPRLHGLPGWSRLVGAAVFALATTATNPLLAVAAYEDRHETSSVLVSARHGRRISLADARRLAFAALAEAEERYRAFAAEEARVTAVWEEGG